MPLDYETLRIIWWMLLGLLLIGFAVMDGYNLGVLMALPFIGKTNMERRILINSIAATWEGNQVWFITAGASIFAAWPTLYALSFSSFYFALLLVLLALILRPVALKYRSKVDSDNWRRMWDTCLFISGFVPVLIFGVAMGNVIQGIPFNFNDSFRAFYSGHFIELLNPFALLAGLLSVSMLAMHGAFFIRIKTSGVLAERAFSTAKFMALLSVVLFAAGGLWLYFGIDGYRVMSYITHDGPSNPLHKIVQMKPYAWFDNYQTMPIAVIAPLAGLFLPLIALLLSKRPFLAFIASAGAITGIISTVGISMFPFLLPSSSTPGHSLLVWDSSSSQTTLFIMLVGMIIFLPIVLLYTAWVYRILRGKINEDSITTHADSAY